MNKTKRLLNQIKKNGQIVTTHSNLVSPDMVLPNHSGNHKAHNGWFINLNADTLTCNNSLILKGNLINNHRTMFVTGNILTSDCVVIKGTTIAPITATLPSPADCLGQIFIFSTSNILFNFIVVSSAGTTINSAGQTTATFNALDQALILYAKTTTTWLILSNMGRVTLS